MARLYLQTKKNNVLLRSVKCKSTNAIAAPFNFPNHGIFNAFVTNNINASFIIFYVIITAIPLCLCEGSSLGFVSV